MLKFKIWKKKKFIKFKLIPNPDRPIQAYPHPDQPILDLNQLIRYRSRLEGINRTNPGRFRLGSADPKRNRPIF